MKALTLNDLKRFVDSAVEQGYGERTLVIRGDEEGNFYTCVYHGLTDATYFFEGKYGASLYGMNKEDIKGNIIILH